MADDRIDQNTVFTGKVRAGKRNYFVDVKATRNKDYYIIITEERKITRPDGTQALERSKIFLYKEDFAKFNEALQLAEDQVEKLLPDVDFGQWEAEDGVEIISQRPAQG